jgi:anti-sigma B factor antagonist
MPGLNSSSVRGFALGRKRWMTVSPFDPAEHVRVTVTSLHAVVVVEVSGEIDMATCHAMAEPLFGQLDATPPGLVLDLAEIRFMGSEGLAVLIEAHKRAQQGRTSLGIVVPGGSPVARVLAVSGLDELLPIHATMVEAMREVGVHELREPTSPQAL